MTASIPATSLPSPQLYSTFTRIIDAGTMANGNAPVSYSFLQGDLLSSANLRKNATRVDLAALANSPPIFSIDQGLGLGVPTAGLTLTVSAGQAMGFVQNPTAAAVAIPDNTDRTYIWMDVGTPTSAPTFHAVPTSTVAPTGVQVFLGSVNSSSGVILGSDTSGVFYNRGGIAWRITGDTAAPTDSPSANIAFLSRNSNSQTYFWDGNQYNFQITSTAAFAVTNPYTYTSTTLLTTGAATAFFTMTPTDNKATAFKADVVGRMNGAGTSAMYFNANYPVRKQSGTSSLVGVAAPSPTLNADNLSYTAGFSLATANVLLFVGGVAGQTMTWKLNVATQEIG